MKDYKNNKWLLWKYLADMLEDVFDWYVTKFPINEDKGYNLVQYINRKIYVE